MSIRPRTAEVSTIDFRKGADGLVALVRETLGHDPFSGTVFVFRAVRYRRAPPCGTWAPG
jgi:transposase